MPNLPTTEKLTKQLSPITPSKLKSETPGEKFADEFVDFTAPLMVGVNNPRSLVRLGLAGLSATGIGEGVEKFTGSEGKGKGAQIGSYFLLSLLNPRGMKRYINSLYKEADKNAKGITFKSHDYLDELDKLKKEINLSKSPSDSQKKVLSKIDEITYKTDRTMSLEELRETKKSLNEDLSELLINTKDKPTKRRLKSYMSRLSGITKSQMEKVGKDHPEFWKYQSAADEAHGTKFETEFLSRSLEKMVGKSKALKYLSLGALHAGVGASAGVLGGLGAVGAAATYPAVRFVARFARSPSLRRYYKELITGAKAQNEPVVKNASKKIEKELSKSR